MRWDSGTFTPSAQVSVDDFPFSIGDAVKMTLIIFDTANASSLCDTLDPDMMVTSRVAVLGSADQRSRSQQMKRSAFATSLGVAVMTSHLSRALQRSQMVLIMTVMDKSMKI